jgi:hypothetical protein
MDKLDRLGWAAGIAFSKHGIRFGIRTNRPEVVAGLEAFLPPNRRPLNSSAVDELYSLRVAADQSSGKMRQMNLAYCGATRLERSLDLLPVLEALETDLMLRVAECSRRVYVHAGVVAWGEGALLILGEPGSGRSHLVRTLVESGARYYSDRYAVLDSRGRVYPYPTDIIVRDPERKTHDRIPVPRSRSAVRGVPVKGILVTKYRACGKWRPSRKSEGHALLALLRYAVPTRMRPNATLNALKQVAEQAEAHFGARGEADDMPTRLAKLYDGFPEVSNGTLRTRSEGLAVKTE